MVRVGVTESVFQCGLFKDKVDIKGLWNKSRRLITCRCELVIICDLHCDVSLLYHNNDAACLWNRYLEEVPRFGWEHRENEATQQFLFENSLRQDAQFSPSHPYLPSTSYRRAVDCSSSWAVDGGAMTGIPWLKCRFQAFLSDCLHPRKYPKQQFPAMYWSLMSRVLKLLVYVRIFYQAHQSIHFQSYAIKS